MVTPGLPERSWRLDAAGDYDRALQDYDRSIKINPSYAKAYNNRGIVYEEKGDTNRAVKDFDRSIES